MTHQELMRLIREDNGNAPNWRAWFEADSGTKASTFRSTLRAMNYNATEDGGDQIVLVMFAPADVGTIAETALAAGVTYRKPTPRV